MPSYFRIWGCSVYIKYLQINKLGPWSNKCIFVGQPKESKTYYFYHAEEQNVFISNRAFFLEKKLLMEGTDATKVELEKV